MKVPSEQELPQTKWDNVLTDHVVLTGSDPEEDEAIEDLIPAPHQPVYDFFMPFISAISSKVSLLSFCAFCITLAALIRSSFSSPECCYPSPPHVTLRLWSRQVVVAWLKLKLKKEAQAGLW